jgi:hypothetical protein
MRRAKKGVHYAQIGSIEAAWQGPGGGEHTPLGILRGKYMNEKLPVRADSHELEELSRRFFEHCLPPAWTVTKPQNDYGIDYYVGIAMSGKMTGKEIIVQLKASKKSEGNTDHETITLKTSTYNYLMEHLATGQFHK